MHSEGLLHQLSCTFRTVSMMSSKTSNMPRAVRRAGIFTAQGYQSKLWPNSSSGIFSISVSGASSGSANSILCRGRRQNDCRNRSWLASMFDWARHRSRLRNCRAPIPRCAPPAAAQQHGGNSHAPQRSQINSSKQWYPAVQRG